MSHGSAETALQVCQRCKGVGGNTLPITFDWRVTLATVCMLVRVHACNVHMCLHSTYAVVNLSRFGFICDVEHVLVGPLASVFTG